MINKTTWRIVLNWKKVNCIQINQVKEQVERLICNNQNQIGVQLTMVNFIRDLYEKRNLIKEQQVKAKLLLYLEKINKNYMKVKEKSIHN